jgi:hypothetical protein
MQAVKGEFLDRDLVSKLATKLDMIHGLQKIIPTKFNDTGRINLPTYLYSSTISLSCRIETAHLSIRQLLDAQLLLLFAACALQLYAPAKVSPKPDHVRQSTVFIIDISGLVGVNNGYGTAMVTDVLSLSPLVLNPRYTIYTTLAL